ncbi:MAG: helix-turn-helix transcriptional regulator [Ktedonobacteraceae bacterium]|nr:helix-turn-helix transcriptional regulator [Ktedonobacteraceae bacterium]
MFRLRLKELMGQKGMTSEQVATASGLSLRTIKALCRDIVSGRTRLSTVERLADVLGVALGELVERLPTQRGKRQSREGEGEQ